MMKRVLVGAIVATMLVGGVASAAMVTVTTATNGGGADGAIQNDTQNGPTVTSGTGASMESRNYYVTSTAGVVTSRVKLDYLRFDLTSLSGIASGATLSMQTRTSASKAGTYNLSVYALIDDTLDGYTESALCYSNAPGMLAAPVGFFSVDATKLTLVGTYTFTNPNASSGPFVSTTAALPLDSFINAELATGNKMLTLVILEPVRQSTQDVYFYTKENTSGMIAPTLTFDNVPEPMTLAILGLGGLLIRRRIA
jgi:opacity protein-like surface antigen